MSALVCGSIAYDNLMSIPDKFSSSILPEQLHKLNAAFLVPELRREFGGTAGNIIYNLKLLGGAGTAMATVGADFGKYADWMDARGISRELVKIIDDQYCAQAYITSDVDGNQIIMFHPGAMNNAHEQVVPSDAGYTRGIVSPDGRDGMIAHAEQFAEANIPFIFDPGQGLPMFNGDDLGHFLDLATYVAVNDYESEQIQDRTGLTTEQVAERVDAYIITRGGDGAQIYTDGGVIDIPAGKPAQLAEPTGCGDAFRAGLLFGMEQAMDWQTTGRIASLMGAIKIEHKGTQNHSFTFAEFAQRFHTEFGYSLN